MKRGLINLTVDTLAAVSLLLMVLTVYILKFPLPPTTNRSYALWGMSRHEWGTIHAWAGAALMSVLLIHIVLHWDWIFSMIRRRFTTAKAGPKQSFRAGLIAWVTFAIACGLFAWMAETGVQDSEAPRRRFNRHQEPTTNLSMSASIVPLGSSAAPEAADFQREVWPLLQAACLNCHGPRKERADFRVDQRQSFFAESDAGPLIVPGDSDKSRLIAIVSGEVKNMRSAREHLLPAREIDLMKTWIDAGANWPLNK